MMWLCPKIENFWVEIKNEISKIIGVRVELDPLQCILGLNPTSVEINRYKRILQILWYCARLTILQHWLDEDVPSVAMWLQNVLQLLPLERLTHVLQGDVGGFFLVWGPVLEYMGEENTEILLRGFAN